MATIVENGGVDFRFTGHDGCILLLYLPFFNRRLLYGRNLTLIQKIRKTCVELECNGWRVRSQGNLPQNRNRQSKTIRESGGLVGKFNVYTRIPIQVVEFLVDAYNPLIEMDLKR